MTHHPTMSHDSHKWRIPARATTPSTDGEDDPALRGAWRVRRKSHEKRY